MDYNSSVVCNAIGYPTATSEEASATPLKTSDAADSSSKPRTVAKNAHKTRHQHRKYIHQWICIQDIADGLITCNHVLKSKSINEILIKMDLWLKQRFESKTKDATTSAKRELPIIDTKSFKANARQLVWDLMEMK